MATETLFTAILDYKGGTYILQILANSPEEALAKWATSNNAHNLTNWNLSSAEAKRLSEQSLVPIEGCRNVWCVSDSGKAGLILLNIVATCS